VSRSRTKQDQEKERSDSNQEPEQQQRKNPLNYINAIEKSKEKIMVHDSKEIKDHHEKRRTTTR